MKPWIAALLEQSSRVVEGLDFNAASYAAREEVLAEHGVAVSYEVVLDEAADGRRFAEATMVKLEEHLEAKRIPSGQAAGVLVWVWFSGRAHLFDGAGFFEVLRRIEPPRLPPPQGGTDIKSV